VGVGPQPGPRQLLLQDLLMGPESTIHVSPHTRALPLPLGRHTPQVFTPAPTRW
jgi:hypothetical protein